MTTRGSSTHTATLFFSESTATRINKYASSARLKWQRDLFPFRVARQLDTSAFRIKILRLSVSITTKLLYLNRQSTYFTTVLSILRRSAVTKPTERASKINCALTSSKTGVRKVIARLKVFLIARVRVQKAFILVRARCNLFTMDYSSLQKHLTYICMGK